MDIVSTLLSAAKVAKVSGILLVAICSHESMNFKKTFTPDDKGSPSFGVCQVKYNTAYQMGFRGAPEELQRTRVNAKYAALYLQYEQERYGDKDWCVLAAAFNAGSYVESKKVPGYPANLKYVRLVQEKLPDDFKDRLSCGNTDVAEN